MFDEQPDLATIERFLRRNVGLHIYELGDLDPFFAPHVRWYGWTKQQQLEAVSLLYTASSPPTLLSFSDDFPAGTRAMMAASPNASLCSHQLRPSAGPGRVERRPSSGYGQDGPTRSRAANSIRGGRRTRPRRR